MNAPYLLLFVAAPILAHPAPLAPEDPETCNDMAFCVCEIKIDASTTEIPYPPPSCFDHAVMTFSSTEGSEKDGCCDDGVCVPKTCRYRIVYAAYAAEGQTCSFKMSPPQSVGQPVVSRDKDSVTYSIPSVQNLACGVNHEYQYRVKVGEEWVLVHASVVKCENCSGPE